ncbi:hypothetical protein ACFQ0X_44095 [Streptomyces rectiviolaceus]|uniref:Uncharacterized protein n=1 Tax=Streptomyces rectiviolaceus TaxID=332591 RepID=A0ABP6NQE8_9ACTN
MRNTLYTLAVLGVLGIPLLYAEVVHVRHKRRLLRGLPARHRTPLTEARQRLLDEVKAYQQTRAEVEQIMRDAHVKFGPLYDTPTREMPARDHVDH